MPLDTHPGGMARLSGEVHALTRESCGGLQTNRHGDSQELTLQIAGVLQRHGPGRVQSGYLGNLFGHLPLERWHGLAEP
jgi:hypothetical protein